MTRRTGMLPGAIGREGIVGVRGACAWTRLSAIATRAHTTRAVRRMFTSRPDSGDAVAISPIQLDPARRRMAGRGAMCAAAIAIAVVTDPSRALAQEHVVDLVGGAAATGTSAAQQTLAIARVEAISPRFFFRD